MTTLNPVAWRELTDGPQWFQENDLPEWFRRWAALLPPMPGEDEITWAWVEGSWFVQDREPGGLRVVRLLSYIRCRDPKQAMATDVFGHSHGCSRYDYRGVPATYEQALLLCAEFDSRAIRWMEPRKFHVGVPNDLSEGFRRDTE